MKKLVFPFAVLPFYLLSQTNGDTAIIGATIYKVFPEAFAVPNGDTAYILRNDTVFKTLKIGIDSSVFHYTRVDERPYFPNGQEAMMEFIHEEFTMPEEDKNNGRQGKVVVRFIINTDGSVSDPTITQGLSTALDAEAKRVVRLLHFVPGKKGGKAVRTSITLSFKIQRHDPNDESDNAMEKYWDSSSMSFKRRLK
jgi:TonB family protein